MATIAEPRPDTTSQARGGPTIARGWGTDAPDRPLRPMEFERRALRADDVAIKITYAGICHSDLSMLDNEWGNTRYPLIAGHEIIGTITALGSHAKGLRIGQRVGLGWYAGSCMHDDNASALC